MTLSEFRTWSLSQGSVCKYDTGDICGECVSLVNQYCYRVLGTPAKAWGHAYAWAQDSNPNRQYFDKVASPQAGDVGVLGTNFNPGYGHIFIYLSPTTLLEQNGRISRKVSTGGIYNATPAAILRKKGGSMAKFTAEQEKVAAMMATGSVPGANYNYPFTAKDIDVNTVSELLNTWNSRAATVTAGMEKTLAKIATGSEYGADYSSPFQGKPVLQVLTPMLEFWLGQRSGSTAPAATKLTPGLYKVE